MKAKAMGVILFLMSTQWVFAASFSNYPEEGLWWNPTESGRGWSIEVQDNIIAVTHYVYDNSARATFFTSAGAWDGLGFTGALVSSQSGQCIGCSYVPPTNSVVGNVRFSFNSPITGTVTYPNGTTIPIQRLVYGYAGPTQALMGGWTSSYGASGSYLGEPLVLLSTFTTSAIPLGVQGTVDGRASQPAVFAPIQPGGNDILGIVASSGSFNTYYRFTRDRLNAWKGFACPYPASGSVPTSCSIPMIAHRWVGANAYRQLSSQQPINEKAFAQFHAAREMALGAMATASAGRGDHEKANTLADALHARIADLRAGAELR